jgi:hypothetical protein
MYWLNEAENDYEFTDIHLEEYSPIQLGEYTDSIIYDEKNPIQRESIRVPIPKYDGWYLQMKQDSFNERSIWNFRLLYIDEFYRVIHRESINNNIIINKDDAIPYFEKAFNYLNNLPNGVYLSIENSKNVAKMINNQIFKDKK